VLLSECLVRLGFMTMTSESAHRLPRWVVPGEHAVSDVACLALRGVVENHSRQECAGMVAAIGWVRHLVPRGPVTGRDELVITLEVAQAESFAAASTRTDWRSPPLREVCEVLGVEYWPASEVDPGYGWGVCATLRWLSDTDGAEPPLPIPVRIATGAVATQEQVYSCLRARNPGRLEGWERAALRREASEIAARSQYLADLVIDTCIRAPA
jgi:hypothetical protein